MSNEIILRDCNLNDAKAIADIFNESVATDITLDDEFKSEISVNKEISSLGERESIIVLADNKEVLGWGKVKAYSPKYCYRFCCESSVYVRRKLMGRGYGSRIKKALITRAKEYEYHHMVSRLTVENIICFEYLKKFNFRLVGIQKEIGYKDGRWRDIAILQLILDETARK